jgi:AcrR family transcriptional regulator
VHDEFAALPPTKRSALIRESIQEFAEHGYARASTNRIVQRVGIAKGSLFHYFGTKERLYLALLDAAAERIRKAVQAAAQDLPGNPVERVIALARGEFGFYAANPELYRLFRRAVSDPDTAKMVRARYADSGMALFGESLAGAAFADGVDEPTATAVLAWIVNGFNEAFVPTATTTTDPEVLLRHYEAGLRRYLSIVAPCVCSATDNPNSGGST